MPLNKETKPNQPGWVIPKTQKMVLDVAMLNIQVRIKGKVKQSRERSSTLPYTSV